MKQIFKSFIIIISFMPSAFATDKDFMGISKDKVKDIIQTMRVYDASITYPYPSWFSTGTVGEVYKDQPNKGNTFIYEQIPTGQTFNDWKELYAVFGYYDKSNKINLSTFANSSLAPYQNSCGNTFKAFQIAKDDNSLLINVYCGTMSRSSNKMLSAYSGEKGEFAIFKFIKFKNTYIKIYQEWQVKSFDINDKSLTKKLFSEIGKDTISTATKKINASEAIQAIQN